MELVHATCVAIKGKAVLLCGPSGAGKSDLALRLISRGAKLVSDDYVELEKSGEGLVASPPAKIAGKMEIRGIGLRDFTYEGKVPVALAINLVARGDVPRLPEPEFKDFLGFKLPCYALHAFDMSTPDKILLLFQTN